LLAIESGISLPFLLYAVGTDAVAEQVLFIMFTTAVVSQIPKRFIWRYRPFMRNRAFCLRRDLTSSFPSRAVTCAVVYGFILCSVFVQELEWEPKLPMWAPFFLFVVIILGSYSRAQYGSHYPSDCLAGAVQALIACALGTFLLSLNPLGCFACGAGHCHSRTAPIVLAAMNWPLIAGVSVAGAAITAASIIPPLRFWVKCHHVYGTLFACAAFQIFALCPEKNQGRALSWPRAAPLWVGLTAISIAAVATIIGMKSRRRIAFPAYLLLYVGQFVALVVLRSLY
jgi:hypothetical protein